jgi:hypothetical protein
MAGTEALVVLLKVQTVAGKAYNVKMLAAQRRSWRC